MDSSVKKPGILATVSEPFRNYFTVSEKTSSVSEQKWCIMGYFDLVTFLASLPWNCSEYIRYHIKSHRTSDVQYVKIYFEYLLQMEDPFC